MKEFGDAKPEGENKKNAFEEKEPRREQEEDAKAREDALRAYLRRVGKPEDEIREDD